MKKKQILVVEDESNARLTLSIILKRAGYDLIVEENGLKALHKLKKLKNENCLPELLLTDLQMPEMTGIELIDKLEKLDIKLPVLVMTGYGNKEVVIELMRKGCAEYIDKPFEPKELLQRISMVLEKQEKINQQKNKETQKYAQEKAELNRKVESYIHRFERLRDQVDSAVGAYKSLIKIKESDYKVRVAYKHKPFAELGGDFIDIQRTPTGCSILIADVAGHDMGASYHTVLIKAFFDENFCVGYNGKTFFKLLNKQLIESSSEQRMVTAILLNLNLETMVAELTSAAHPPVIRISKDMMFLKNLMLEGDVLGIHHKPIFESIFFSFAPGDRFILRTDGITNIYKINRYTGKKEKFNESSLHMLIKKHCRRPLEEMIEKIENAVIKNKGYKINDDMLILGLEIPA